MDQSVGESQSLHLVSEASTAEEGVDFPDNYIIDVVMTHDQSLGNYTWLHPYYGKLLWIDFEEPAGSGNWRTYDRYWFGRHGSVIDHTPENLYEDHINEFVNPKTKSINLLFWFQRPNGEVYSTPPNEHFYKLEAEYFKRWKLCTEGSKLSEHGEDKPKGPEPLYCQKYKGKSNGQY